MTAASTPIPLILFCPGPVSDGHGGQKMCGTRHIDEGDFATIPHRTHTCQACGFQWAPGVVPTVGVQFLPGTKNKQVGANVVFLEKILFQPAQQRRTIGGQPHRWDDHAITVSVGVGAAGTISELHKDGVHGYVRMNDEVEVFVELDKVKVVAPVAPKEESPRPEEDKETVASISLAVLNLLQLPETELDRVSLGVTESLIHIGTVLSQRKSFDDVNTHDLVDILKKSVQPDAELRVVTTRKYQLAAGEIIGRLRNTRETTDG